MDIVVRDLDSGEETVVFDDGGYVVQTTVSHDESSVAVTALSLQPNGTVISLAGPLAGPRGSGALTDPRRAGQPPPRRVGARRRRRWSWSPTTTATSTPCGTSTSSGTLAAAGRARRPRPGRPALPRRHLDARQPPRRRPRHPGDPRDRRHPPRRRRPRARRPVVGALGRRRLALRDHRDDAHRPGLDPQRRRAHRRGDPAGRRPRRGAGRAARPPGHPDRAPGAHARRRGGARASGSRRPTRTARWQARPSCTSTAGPSPRRPGCSRRCGSRWRWPASTCWCPTCAARRGTGSAGSRSTTSSCGWTPWPTWRPSTSGCRRSGSTRRARRCGAAPTAATWCSPASPCSRSGGPPGSTSSASRRW